MGTQISWKEREIINHPFETVFFVLFQTKYEQNCDTF